MQIRPRNILASAVLVAAMATSASAQFSQVRVEEVRIDLAGLSTTGGTRLFAGIPGALALGVYLSDAVALEPRASFDYTKPDGQDGTLNLDFGVYAPFYFSGNRGHSGLFLAPGMSITKLGDADATFDFGADLGYKIRSTERMSWRVAAEIRNFDDLEIGGRFGLSIWWR